MTVTQEGWRQGRRVSSTDPRAPLSHARASSGSSNSRKRPPALTATVSANLASLTGQLCSRRSSRPPGLTARMPRLRPEPLATARPRRSETPVPLLSAALASQALRLVKSLAIGGFHAAVRSGSMAAARRHPRDSRGPMTTLPMSVTTLRMTCCSIAGSSRSPVPLRRVAARKGIDQRDATRRKGGVEDDERPQETPSEQAQNATLNATRSLGVV